MRTLFLQAPTFDGFDGGAGSRYQAKREIKSFWYPTWLAQPAALVPNSKLIDAPPHNIKLQEIVAQANDFDLVVLHTSVPSFKSDVKTVEALKAANPKLIAGLIGAKVAVDAAGAMAQAPCIDFCARNEFDFTVKEVADGTPMSEIKGLSYRNADGVVVHNEDREIMTDMDQLPFVTSVYKRDLEMEKYFIGYLKHPYISFYSGRGCKSRCTFCLWPQTVGGHTYRTRSVAHVIEEIKYCLKEFPQTKEFFFDDDTFTDNLPRAEEIARELGKLGVTWSCNAKANVPRETLKVLKENGLRLLLVGYESGNQKILNNIKKGMRVEVAEKFTKDCHDLGIAIHGTFIVGLPGETRRRSRRRSPSPSASTRTPSRPRWRRLTRAPSCTSRRSRTAGSTSTNAELVDENGVQIAPLHYPHLSHSEIFAAVEEFYRKFYFRAPKIASIVSEMVRSPDMMKRRLREGVEFYRFLKERQGIAKAA